VKVAICIEEWSSVPSELIFLWKRWERRGDLIDWHLASVYFVKNTPQEDTHDHIPE